MVDFKKCYAVTGFNTKQVWVYDEEHDSFIDPPASVLDAIDEQVEDSWDFEEKENLLNDILESNPDWLQDSDYSYSAKNFEI